MLGTIVLCVCAAVILYLFLDALRDIRRKIHEVGMELKELNKNMRDIINLKGRQP
jgi:hypothetical protein